ncbi:MAG: 1-acyl-sn-glycerol-3-phosphate acyltransferase [Planctomycetes bacterium]|nr:1-acyl-sn-glycerol-3-phosphate acyltransferase [Planctomycetota bacterium]
MSSDVHNLTDERGEVLQRGRTELDAAPRTLRGKLERLWRALGTGLFFVAFYSGCVLIIAPAFLVALLSSRKRDVRRQRVQWVIHVMMRAFTGSLELCRILSTSHENLQAFRGCRGTLIIANHPSLLDVTFLLAYVHPIDCVVKRDLWRSALTRPCVVGADYIPNDEGAALVEACVERLKRGRNIVLFPEGTRSPIGGLQPFQRGVARIALESGCDILPVLIRCSPPFLTKGAKWYRAPLTRPHFAFSVGARLRADRQVDLDLERPAAVRQLTRDLETYYQDRLAHDRA